MTTGEFLQRPRVEALLARASTAAGTPLSVHLVKRNQEQEHCCGWGGCAACKKVSELPGGVQACRLSRLSASAMALRQQRPISYLCHMGFACVAVAPVNGEDLVVTLGPFCPMEEQRSLEDDVRAGLEALTGEDYAELPFSLDDIHRAPSSSVPAVADWLKESLASAQLALETAGASNVTDDSEESSGAGSGRLRNAGMRDANDRLTTLSRDIASSLSGESHARARSLILGVLEEQGRGGAKNMDTRRATVAALVSSVLGALGQAGLTVESAWTPHARFIERLPRITEDKELLDGAMAVFSFLRRSAHREVRDEKLPDYPELHALVTARLLDGITLEAVAAEIGQTPSAISHRLKRKFGMSFSDYVGRIRIDKAKELFRHTGLNATEISRRVGIGDQSNFSKLFKRFEGVSPSEYRKRYRKKV